MASARFRIVHYASDGRRIEQEYVSFGPTLDDAAVGVVEALYGRRCWNVEASGSRTWGIYEDGQNIGTVEAVSEIER